MYRVVYSPSNGQSPAGMGHVTGALLLAGVLDSCRLPYHSVSRVDKYLYESCQLTGTPLVGFVPINPDKSINSQLEQRPYFAIQWASNL